MPSLPLLKALGLNFSPNQLEVEPGSLVEASNVIIRRDNVIESRRGYALYGTSMGDTADRCKQLITYKNKLIRHFSNHLQYEDGLNNEGLVTFVDFEKTTSGGVLEPQTGLKIKSIEANSNLYFTSSEGIKKISAKSAEGFGNSSITQAGGIKALDSQVFLNVSLGDSSSFLPSDAGVAYKVVWGTKDANSNLVLGAPSDAVTILNPLLELCLRDFSNFLFQLTNVTASGSSLLNDTDYYSSLALPINGNAVELRNNLISLAKKLDKDLVFATHNGSGSAFSPLAISSTSVSSGVVTINFSAPGSANDYFSLGDKINIPAESSGSILGFTSNNVSIDGINTSQIITSRDTGYIKFTAKDYTANNPVGISGTITNISTVPAQGTGVVVLACSDHKLKDQQRVRISGSNSAPSINGDYLITYLSKDTFSVDLKKEYTKSSPLAQDISCTNHGYIAGDSISFDVTTPLDESVTFTDATNRVNLSNHGLQSGNIVTFKSISNTTGITTNTNYYVISPSTNDFQLATTLNGTAIDLVVSGSGTGTMNRVIKGSTYYVLSDNLTTNTFRVSTTINGAINIITGSGKVAKVIPQIGTAASWNILVDAATSTTQIESNLFRSITEPDEQSTPATNAQLLSLQNYLSLIISNLQDFVSAHSNKIISTSVYASYLETIGTTTSASVTLKITLPESIKQYTASSNPYFYQIYRTAIGVVSGVSSITDISIIQEYYQIEEKFPTSDEIASGIVTFVDVTPEAIAGTGAYLYTNERSGEGGLQANDIPPFALDINRFKGYTFFSNTSTRQRKSLTLIGATSMFDAFNISNPYKLTISDGIKTNTYTFVTGVPEKTRLACNQASTLSIGVGNYFTINSANNETSYYVWYSVSGSSTDPGSTFGLSGKKGIRVSVNLVDSALVVAQKTAAALNNNMVDFSAEVESLTSTVIVTNKKDGETTNATIGTLPVGFSITIQTEGRGENASNKQVLLSKGGEFLSPSIAIEETVKSLISVINKNNDEIVNAFYISGTNSTPGTFLLEGRTLSSNEFYITTSSSVIGESFNPDLSPSANAITGITSVDSTTSLVTTSSAHSLLNGDKVIICNSNSLPLVNGTPKTDGVHAVICDNTTTSTTFKIAVQISSAATQGRFESLSEAESSSNEEQPHRIYYSKYQQPESVPIANYIDIGATDKAILRIFPLRDSLFVFKEDGLYRLSGEVAPFTVALFDSSCILFAPDSLSIANNQLYGWTTQGISSITEAGVSVISRPIDTEILKKASSQFTNFKTATWGVGYESDNSYTVYTTDKTIDEIATIGFRYSNLTNSWTTVDKTVTCGLVNPADDKLYLGAGDTNYIEKERKEFTRYDYADRELSFDIADGALSGAVLSLPSVLSLSAGDVVVQTQTLTVFEFNSLLQKLDLDLGVPSSNYYSSLSAQAGDNLRQKLEELAQKLDTELSGGYASSIASLSGSILTAEIGGPTKITTSSNHNLQSGRVVSIVNSNEGFIDGTFEVTVLTSTSFTIPVNLRSADSGGTFTTQDNNFQDIKTCYNIIVSKLNADAIVSYGNYRQLDNDTIQEAIISSINKITKTITLNLPLEYVVGPILIYKAIRCEYKYAPLTLGDPLGLKHIREATMMFSSKAFTAAELSFSTDLLPEFISVPFYGDGSGIFGHQTFGQGFFGGASNSAPFRTYLPRQCQRCRYINIGFVHQTAREQFAIYGVTLTGEVGQSTRAYR